MVLVKCVNCVVGRPLPRPLSYAFIFTVERRVGIVVYILPQSFQWNTIDSKLLLFFYFSFIFCFRSICTALFSYRFPLWSVGEKPSKG